MTHQTQATALDQITELLAENGFVPTSDEKGQPLLPAENQRNPLRGR